MNSKSMINKAEKTIEMKGQRNILERCFKLMLHNIVQKYPDVVCFEGVKESTLVYGILYEYAIVSGMDLQASVWGEYFEKGLMFRKEGHLQCPSCLVNRGVYKQNDDSYFCERCAVYFNGEGKITRTIIVEDVL